MSLDNIQLDSRLVTDLYRNVLVSLNNIEENDKSLSNSKISFLGNNNRNVLIFVNDPKNKYLPPEDLDFLTNILSACNLSLADVAIVNIAPINDMLNMDMINDSFNPGVVLFFGVEPRDIQYPLAFPLYKLQQYNNQSYLCGNSLTEISNDVQQKKALWGNLKSIFLNK